MKPLRAISLWQPWASLMALNAKMIETRHWTTNHRGLVAIHAAKKWDVDLRYLARSSMFWEPLSQAYLNIDELPLGAIIAVGNLHRCLSMDDYPEAVPARNSPEFAFGLYESGRFMWVFDHIWKLSSPVYVRGQQGFWTLTEGETDVVTTLMPDDWEKDL